MGQKMKLSSISLYVLSSESEILREVYVTVSTMPVSRLIGSRFVWHHIDVCLLYTSPSPRDRTRSRMPSSA